MPANTDPIYTRTGMKGSVLVTAANTSSQGGGTIATDIFLAATCDATNGSFIQRVRWIPTATTPTTTTATVGRIFLSTIASGATTSANTWLFNEIVLPAIAADNATAAVNFFDVIFGFAIPSGTQTILVTNHAAPAANTAWRAIVIGGDY
jgi:hypothetical protein